MGSDGVRSRFTIREVVGVTAMIAILAAWQAAARAEEPPTVPLLDFGIVPRPAPLQLLLRSPAVEKELGLTEAQKKAEEEIRQNFASKMQQAASDIEDIARYREARAALMEESSAAQLANLNPEQRDRLHQLQLQIQGPLAFTEPAGEPSTATNRPGASAGPKLRGQLGLSGDQAKQAEKIAEEAIKQINKAASFPIRWDAKRSPSRDDLRKLVESPEFRESKEKARRAARAAWEASIVRIESILNPEQRDRYRKLVGRPFDLATIRPAGAMSESDRDVQAVSRALGFGGQRADPGFDVNVARPAFVDRHPRVVIDEAHRNFHTASGRYKPFADLMTHDGFLVSAGKDPIDGRALEHCDILVIANAAAPGGTARSGTNRSAFTEEECSAVQRWVWEGGSLLLITDHEPYGSASEELAHRFGVLMSTSGVTDPANDDTKYGGLIFARDRGLVLDHPITNGRDASERIHRVETFFGQALIGPVGSTPFLRFADTAVFGRANPRLSAAGWAQGVALGYGAGRVVVMGEAGELSAQLAGFEPMGMNVPGIDNRQMALNIMHWLAGTLEPTTIPVPVQSTLEAPPRRRVSWLRPVRFGSPACADGR